MNNNRSALASSLAVLAMALGWAGCATTRPPTPDVINPDNKRAAYSARTFETDQKEYRSNVLSNDFKRATILRDTMIHRVRLEIDSNYHVFEGRIFDSRAEFATVADWIELALAGTTAAVGGEEAKTALGIVLTGVKGARLSLDKNFFREKTTETLLSAMQAERAKRLTLITRKMTQGDASQYSWDEAWVDLLDYFYAGTLESGLLAISRQTGAEAADAKIEMKEAEKERADSFSLPAATRQDVLSARQLTTNLGTLARRNDRASAERILNELHIPFTPQDNVFELLRARIEALQPGDEESRSKLSAAFRRALNP